MTHESESKFHTIRMFNFSSEGEKPEFDLILEGQVTKFKKRGEFIAAINMVPLQVVQVVINSQDISEPVLAYAVIPPGEFQHNSKVIEAHTRGGHHMRLVKEIQNVINQLDTIVMFK